MKKILFIFGTRPEALKLAPVIREFKNNSSDFQTVLCATGQHNEMLQQVLSVFNLKADHNLGVMKSNQSLSSLTANLIQTLDPVVEKESPDYIIVQGDTTSSFIGSLVGFYHKIPVAHVEAGLRSYSLYEPFPEEVNRKFTTTLSSLHFAPTNHAKENLLKEGVDKNSIYVTGNTIVDTIQMLRSMTINGNVSQYYDASKKLILVTAHRRENFGKPFTDIFNALVEIAGMHSDVEIVYPVHLNPNVKTVATKLLGQTKNIHLIEPQSYFEFSQFMKKAFLILTDSGGIQEEAPSYQKPVLVLRNVTERPEGVEAGVAKLVGTKTKTIVEAVNELLTNEKTYRAMTDKKNPYGDGTAAHQIYQILSQKLL